MRHIFNRICCQQTVAYANIFEYDVDFFFADTISSHMRTQPKVRIICGRKSRIFPHMLTFRAHICAAYKTPQMSHYADYSHKYVPILNNRKIHNPQSLDEDEVKKFAK